MSGRASKTTKRANDAARTARHKDDGPREWSVLFGTGHKGAGQLALLGVGGVYLTSGHGDAVWLPDSFRFGA